MRGMCDTLDGQSAGKLIPRGALHAEDTDALFRFPRTLVHRHGHRRLQSTDARHGVLRRDATHTNDALRLHRAHRVRGHVKSRHRAFETDETSLGNSSSRACFASARNGAGLRVRRVTSHRNARFLALSISEKRKKWMRRN